MSKWWIIRGIWGALALAALFTMHHSYFMARWTNKHIVREIGLAGYVLYDLASHALRLLDDIDDVDPAPFNQFLSDRRAGIEMPPPPSRARKRNVVFLQLESVEGMMADAVWEGEPVMPFVSSLKGRVLWFENAFDQTGVGRSADAHVLVMTSQIPIQNEAIFTRYDLSTVRSLPRILKKHGYRSFSTEGWLGHFWRWKLNHRRLGIDASFDMTDLDASEILGWGVSDRSLVRQALDEMSRAPGPFLAYIILLSHHHPFRAIHESLGLPDRGMVQNYIVGCRYTDTVIRSLFDGLAERGLLDDTIIAVYSDHDSGVTQELAEAFGREHTGDPDVDERIPLLLWVGGEAGRVEKPVGLQDLAPTVLSLLGVEIPRSFVGIPFQSPQADVLLPNGRRIRRMEGGKPAIEPLEVDIDTLTRLAIERPEALID